MTRLEKLTILAALLGAGTERDGRPGPNVIRLANRLGEETGIPMDGLLVVQIADIVAAAIETEIERAEKGWAR